MMNKITEKKLVDELARYFEDRGYLVSREVAMGYGVADLVAYHLDLRKCAVRFQNKQTRPLNRVEYYTILRLMPDIDQEDKGISLEEICDKLSYSTKYLREVFLSYLIKSGYVKHLRNQLYARVNGFIPIADEIVAVEAKISDWKKGAIQAKRYKLFANKVFLALHQNFTHRVRQDLLEKHNIGLISLENGNVNEIVSPKNQTPLNEDMHACAADVVWRAQRNRNRIKELIAHNA